MQLMSQDANWCWLNVECYNVRMFQWSNVQMFKCSNVTMIQCSNVFFFSKGCKSFLSIGPLVHWYIFRLVPWVYWSIGPLDYWSIGPLVECQMLKVNKVKLLSERTSGVPLVIFHLILKMTSRLETFNADVTMASLTIQDSENKFASTLLHCNRDNSNVKQPTV